MSYSIQRLQLLNFRGYGDTELADFGDLVVFAGKNATGKTNLIESIQLLTAADSFRNPTNKELIRWGADQARISSTFVDDKRTCEHVLSIQPGGRHYEINGKRRPAADIRGTIPSVLFIPNDLQMIKSSSSTRRDALDAIGTQLSDGYGTLKQEYAAALR
ncbi:MAG: AAA family ATPase, partial [Coriobacteriaceae bacterium]|nr:AAA family ATPase [Coriobacteriaceae bacterium]